MILSAICKGNELLHFDVAVSYQFFGWLVALGGDAVIVGPDKVKEEMQELIAKGFTE